MAVAADMLYQNPQASRLQEDAAFHSLATTTGKTGEWDRYRKGHDGAQ